MRKRFFLFVVILLLGLFLILVRERSPAGIELTLRFPYDFLEPLTTVEINGVKRTVLVDLGSAVCDFHLEKRVLLDLKDKERLEDGEMGDLRGNVYPTFQFRVPEIKLGEVSLLNPIVAERNHEHLYNTYAIPGPNTRKLTADRSDRIDGKIGLRVFERYNCLFDFPNSKILLFDHNAENQCKSDRFIPVPFSIEKYGVVLTVETDGGPRKMVLDTGATHSVIRRSTTKLADPDTWYHSTDHFLIGGCDYGPWDLILFDVSEEWDIDGCIGTEFFLEYPIFLDFKNQVAYIQKPEKFALQTQWKRAKFRMTQLYRKIMGRFSLLAQAAESTEVTVEITWDFLGSTL